MSQITNDTLANLFFQVNWSTSSVQHTDAYAARHVNLWRDRLPRRLYQTLLGKKPGDQVRMSFSPGELLETIHRTDMRMLPSPQFDTTRVGIKSRAPRSGRFYPKGMLKDVAGIFRANRDPFRCLQVNNGHIQIDMGHPLAHYPLAMNVTVGSVQDKSLERGGSMQDWGAIITEGLGMQSRWKDHPTDFFSNAPFQREDQSDDGIFYTRPRLVQHIDDTAMDMLKQVYSRFLKDGLHVLDLMSSWQSHLPDNVDLGRLSGLGLNEAELQRNPELSDYKVWDLNNRSQLPYDDSTYDLVLCSLSVEYLVHPREIFKEIARVLRPEGWLVVSFSNRWFPPKAIRIWSELHDFERMGLVLEYFRMDNRFDQLHTYSVRGMERPTYDKYFRQLLYADPIYAVWGQKK